MDALEIQAALKSFRIIVDTREQNTPRAKERFDAIGCPIGRETLRYGDYCGDVTLSDGSRSVRVDGNHSVHPVCVIERKMSADELAGCFTRSRERFQREMERAVAEGCRVFLLVENCSFETILNHRYRSRYNSNAFLASVTAWTARYGITPVFCKAETSGRIIRELLYRDLKERLERGDYG